MGPLVVEALRPLAQRFGATMEVHLMIEAPDRFLGDFSRAGANAMTVHLEACPHLHRTVYNIRALNAQPGVALNPATPLMLLDDILPEIDVALLMSVDPGFGGQKFIAATTDKVARLHKILCDRGLERVEIEVDGGVTETNIAELRRRLSLIEQDVEGERGVSRHILRKVTEGETALLDLRADMAGLRKEFSERVAAVENQLVTLRADLSRIIAEAVSAVVRSHPMLRAVSTSKP